jgi:predicted RNase H-like nuclease (RuvC/YqgF family)
MQSGCSIVVPYDGLEKHEQQCDYQLKKCEGCQRELLLKDLTQHQQQCDQLDLKCLTCETFFKRKDIKNHNEVQCLKQQLQQQKDQVQQLKQEIQQLKGLTPFIGVHWHEYFVKVRQILDIEMICFDLVMQQV